jgi:hypothetical protein
MYDVQTPNATTSYPTLNAAHDAAIAAIVDGERFANVRRGLSACRYYFAGDDGLVRFLRPV